MSTPNNEEIIRLLIDMLQPDVLAELMRRMQKNG